MPGIVEPLDEPVSKFLWDLYMYWRSKRGQSFAPPWSAISVAEMKPWLNDLALVDVVGDAPRFTDDELRAIGSPVDFVGLNIYGPSVYVQASESPPGYAVLPVPESHPRLTHWLIFGPEALYWGPRQTASLWNVKDIYITENGTPAADKPAADGIVYDVDRIMFLRQYLAQLRRATAEGVSDSTFGAGVSTSAVFCSTASGGFVFCSVSGLAIATCCFFSSSILARAKSAK